MSSLSRGYVAAYEAPSGSVIRLCAHHHRYQHRAFDCSRRHHGNAVAIEVSIPGIGTYLRVMTPFRIW